MPYVPKSTEEEFNSGWQKASAWASSQGIGAGAVNAVYQMDLTRLQNGEYPMGTAERNLAIAAAHNPNVVQSAPADNPNPSNVVGNAVSDAGKIATGIEGIFTGSFEKQVWNSAKATVKAVTDPASQAKQGAGIAGDVGGTIGNWLSNTLLAYLPGAADIGTVLQHDPTLTGSSGAKALAAHPLVSLLDIIPGEGGLATKAASRVGADDLAASLAARGGNRSALGEVVHQIGQTKVGGKAGAAVRDGKTQLAEKLSVSDRVTNLVSKLGPGGSGFGPTVGALAEAIQGAGMMSSEMYTWLLDAPTQALKALKPEDVADIKNILDQRRTTGGDSVRDAMTNPAISPATKDVLQMWVNGPLRFATENEIFAANLRPVVSLNGDVGMWAASGKGIRNIMRAKNAMEGARRASLKTIDELDPHVDRVAALDAMRASGVTEFSQRLASARQQVFSDPALQRPLTRELPNATRFRAKAGLSRVDQLHAVVDEGGIADQFFKQIQKSSDPDLVGTLAKAMKERLSHWGPQSVDAAEHPALQSLYQAADVFDKWATMYRKESKAIDEAIFGHEGAQRHHLEEQMAYRRQGLQILKDRHTREREELDLGYRKQKSVRMAQAADKIRKANEARIWYTESVEQQAEIQARGVTNRVLDTTIMPEVNRRIRAFNQTTTAAIKQARRDLTAQNKLGWTEYQRDSSKMVRRHYTELQASKKIIAGERAGMGDALREAVGYGNAVRGFHKAVMDNPADQYRDVFVALIQKHIVDSEETAALTIATDRYLKSVPKMTQKRLQALREDPDVIAELTMAHFHEIMNQPDLDPEIAEEAKGEMEQYRADAHEELKLLIGQGLKIQYIPTATSFDERLGRDSMAPLIGHGIPKPDMAKEKVWELTPHKDDFALGINKAVVQALQRDSTIYLAEHYLKPMALTQKQVNEFLLVFKRPEERATGGNVVHEMQSLTAEDLGLEKFDPRAMFGFQLPRWSQADALYLPKPVVNALREFEKQRKASLLGKSNRLFRYSILGLSPRYTAHIIFGGTMMLALRSSPYAVTMIGDAARALRDGTLPSGIGGRTTELGFEEPIHLVQRAQGKDMASLAVGEHIETRQKVKLVAAKPIHALRALADINFRFTTYVRNMQAAMSYLDGAAKMDRKGGSVEVEDPETGKMVKVSSERAVKEGVHHVQQVFGNLNRMSPLERQIAQSVMPFYGWQKHILGYVLSFPFDHPYRAMVLSQLAFNSSQQVPLAYPIRLQLLEFLGSPDSSGNVNAVDIRSLDPFRDVANYATWSGFFESLNPALSAPLAMAFGPNAIYGSSSLYPGVTYNAFYGIQTATSGGSWVNGLEQWVPQAGAVVSAAQSAGGIRSEWQTDKSAATKSMLESLNIPFVTPPVNLKQLAAKDENARFESAKTAAYNAFSSGNFAGLKGYTTVPNPLNDAYQITPVQLEALYAQAQKANPGVAPIESLLPPPTPYGW